MKIQVVSDLHTDVNRTEHFGFIDKVKKHDVIVIAGDIAGDNILETKFLNSLPQDKPIICVAGNHLGYNSGVYNGFVTKEEMIKDIKENCLSSVNYLDNESVMIDGKIFFGGTMYTDFNLYGNVPLYSSCGERGLNDFVYVKTKTDLGVRTITSQDYIKWFNIFMEKLKKLISDTEQTNEDIIVVTHFAPSLKSISKKYNGQWKSLNPSYASDLTDFIKTNPRIKLWIHGHMHDCFDYKIGKCRVVCYPYGYSFDRIDSPEDYKGKTIKI